MIMILISSKFTDDLKKRYYKRGLEILYTPEISERPIPTPNGFGEEPFARTLLYFLGKRPCRSAKDFIPYAESDQNPEECCAEAVETIRKCPDAKQYSL